MLTIAACVAVMSASAQDAAKGPMPFDKFFTKETKTINGDFPVYQRGKSYYMEIPATSLDKDILVMGYVRRGNASAIAKSSGIIRFSKGINDYLDVTRPIFSEGASGDANGDIEQVIKKSAKAPVNYGYRIEALGKEKNSYIIDVTRQITDAGDWFAFNDLSFLSHPDPQRFYVQRISPENNGVRFVVERSQTDYMGNTGAPKKAHNNSYEIEMLFSELPDKKMPRKIAPEASGFETFSFTDYGKVAYTARKSEFIRKWDVRPGKQKKGLVAPVKAISVVIDPLTPEFYRSYIKAGVLAWNEAFQAAGYQDVLEVTVGNDLQLAPGKIVINWGNAYAGVLNSTVDNPETGEIMMARINLMSNSVEELMLRYFVQCGATDPRIVKDIKSREVTGEILRWQVTRTMGQVLGLKENPAASTRYTPAALRDAASLKKHSISASIMDELNFNYLAQPQDQVPVSLLMPHIGEDDIAAIKWAYGTAPKPSYVWLPEGKTDPFTRQYDLSNDLTEAAILGIRNLEHLYPQLKAASLQLDGSENLFNANGSLYGAVQREYYKYVTDVLSQIGGMADRKTGRVVTPVAQQRKALQFLSAYVFNGAPAWMTEKVTPSGRVIDVDGWIQQLQETALNRLASVEVLAAAAQPDGIGATEIFAFIDKTVFKSFDKKRALTAGERTTQLTFMYNLAQAAYKANISNGLGDGNVLLHYYLTTTAQKLAQLGEEHTDLLSRETYRLMKMSVDKEFLTR
ncbi:zinc-dependent metalloprotease [Chitinophaga sedimenti]|uniref:DUF5117 and DUF5118 domain-containing protein n=1 Tax=Chitinophaga sedimenti TaxID=2033606 RepID=UPI002002A1A3|nr:zinc-dependent metalloprotease [Chitinophaga sedimenti]MCK7554692.1 zinc-dependent metalloprotease [Chitinophaga sedimenti]